MKILFMPGAGGDPTFWQPVADRLPTAWQKTPLGWPGRGNQPPAPDVNGWDDLYRTVEARIDGKVAIVAQSMGGVLAMQAALAHPRSVSHLVLTATSGGIDLTPFHAQDWRDEYRRSNPHVATWVYERNVSYRLSAPAPASSAPAARRPAPRDRTAWATVSVVDVASWSDAILRRPHGRSPSDASSVSAALRKRFSGDEDRTDGQRGRRHGSVKRQCRLEKGLP